MLRPTGDERVDYYAALLGMRAVGSVVSPFAEKCEISVCR